jgi:uncharacterized repeat protein (TIGR01451 family)
MNLLRKHVAAVVVLAGLVAGPFGMRAQDFGLGATASPDPVLVRSPILYTIDVTNTFGFSIQNVYLTNAISGPFIFNSFSTTNSQILLVATNSDGIIFRINTFIAGAVAQLTLSLSPIVAGSLTNEIIVGSFNHPSETTNLVTQVNFPATDLAVGMTNVPSGLFTNDTTVIGLTVTNLGPNAASDVVVSNTLPASFRLLSVSPAGVSYTFNGGNLVFDLGRVTSGSWTQLLVSVQPTNPGTFSLTASVTAADNVDTNTVNNSVTNTMEVSSFFPAALSWTVVSQQVNHQTGLLEMSVLLSNNATTNVPAVRLVVSGLTNNTWLYNASGTNAGSPYVLYNAPLAGGASVTLRLEFYVLLRSPLTNYKLEAFALPAINLTPSSTAGTTITNYVMSSGGFLIEFPATIGQAYTILYSDNLSFSNALTAQPTVVAPASRVQWIDNGPPKTVSHPSNTVQRYYRVFQAP